MIKNCAANIVKILLFLSILSFDVAAQGARPTSFDKRPACEAELGSWRRFGNGCADSCRAKFDKFSMCTQALVYACDCGDEKCWNGKYCVGLEDYERVYKSVQKRKKKKLDEEKEQRSLLAAANRNKILKKFLQPDPESSKDGKGDVVDRKDVTMLPKEIDNKENPTTQVQIPPFFLKKQAQQAAARKALKESSAGSELPIIPLP